MKPWRRFWWGEFGACLPEILRWHNLSMDPKPLPSYHWWLFVPIQIALIISAGLFTRAAVPKDAKSAIWIGASFQTLVSVMLSNAPKILP